MKKRIDYKDRKQFGFLIDKALQNRIRKVVNSIPGVTQADLGRVALNEKLTELEARIAAGQTITISV
jgi:hypothetical protein